MSAPKTLFVTGASGYIGSTVTELAVAEGWIVRGLSRSDAADERVRAAGGTPVRGDLTSLDVLRGESAAADAVVHLATVFVFGQGPYSMEKDLPLDNAAVDAIADGLAGTGKPLIATSGTLFAAPDPTGAETTEESPEMRGPIANRHLAVAHALAQAARGIRVVSVRLAPFVYGRGKSGVGLFMGMAAQAGSLALIDGGRHRTTTVHVDDAARLYLLAINKGKAGDVVNASADTNVTGRELFTAIAAAVGVPLAEMTFDEAKAAMGEFVAWFLSAENRASGAKARREWGWEPKGISILEDITKGSYVPVAAALRKPKVNG